MTLRRLLARWVGLLAVGIRQTVSRATATATQRLRFSVLGVAVVIALLITVTGIGVGLATGTTVADEDADYWIVPETDGADSPLVATEDPQFGSVHETNTEIRQIEGVESSTPVLSQVHRVDANGTSEHVLLNGVISSPGLDRVGGLDAGLLSPNDPYYATDDWTGEVVLSRSAAETLSVSPGDSVTVAGNSSFTVTAIDDNARAGGGMPAALLQLGELQAVTGAAADDQADEFVVHANSPGVDEELADVYPKSSVNSRGEMLASDTEDSELSHSLALIAFVVSLSVGTLFVVTTSGLELVTDRQQLTTLSAMGISVRSQLQLVGTQTLVMTALGGVIGSIGGLVGIRAVNAVAVRTLTNEPIAVSHPLFVGYGIGVALLMGVLSLPILLVTARRVAGGVPQ